MVLIEDDAVIHNITQQSRGSGCHVACNSEATCSGSSKSEHTIGKEGK
jgi:hypothetical protein